jgi:hypothetical protein
LNAKTRYVRVEATSSSGGATPYQLFDFQVAGSHLAQPNLAGGKAYERTEPSTRFPDAAKSEATDGVLGDDWGDGKSFGYELLKVGDSVQPVVTIDLGRAQPVGKVRVHAYEEYPDYRPDQITVSTSTDGTNFTERAHLSSVNGSSNIWYDVGFAPATARWVRVTFDKARTNDRNTGMFLDEIEAYGPAQPH